MVSHHQMGADCNSDTEHDGEDNYDEEYTYADEAKESIYGNLRAYVPETERISSTNSMSTNDQVSTLKNQLLKSIFMSRR